MTSHRLVAFNRVTSLLNQDQMASNLRQLQSHDLVRMPPLFAIEPDMHKVASSMRAQHIVNPLIFGSHTKYTSANPQLGCRSGDESAAAGCGALGVTYARLANMILIV